MIIENIINAIDEGGPRSYYSFETFVIHLLRHHLKIQNKELIIEHQRKQHFDALAPKGFDNFKESVAIEIKFNITRLPFSHLIEKIIKRMSIELIEQKIPNLLIISAKPIPEKFKVRFYEAIENLQPRVTCRLTNPK